MVKQPVFKNWDELFDAPKSEFFKGHTKDTIFDRNKPGLSLNTEALFTQSNARVLIAQAANGTFRFISTPTQVYPAPTCERELGLRPGMYYHTDMAMYIGNLAYSISIDSGSKTIDLSGDERDNETVYADHYLPMTRTTENELDISIISLAPVAADAKSAPLAPAPFPGPSGAIYALRIYNKGSEPVKGKIILKASDLLIGHYEDVNPEIREFKFPSIDLRQETLILSRPYGSVGIHLHKGKWIKRNGWLESEREFSICPGEETIFETHIAIGEKYSDIMSVIYGFHLRSVLDWLNLTSAFWRSRLGRLQVGAVNAETEARASLDIHIRSQFDNFNCLQTDSKGNLLSHLQGAPAHRFGTIWGIDVEPTAVSIVNICPELTKQVMLFFMNRSRVPLGNGAPEHSMAILVAPVIIARKWLEITGDMDFFKSNIEVLSALKDIMDEVLSMKASGETLFPSIYSSDGEVGRRYDYGTNVKVWYAFDSMAYILRKLGCMDEANLYQETANDIGPSIHRSMVIDGPFGKQISGGTNLGEDPGNLYIPEEIPYYDGEDTSSMLAPIYGISGFDYEPWINYHRFARSIFCPHYDPEFDTLLWNPAEAIAVDGTALVSRVGGSTTLHEMKEAFNILKKLGIDDVTGSLFWWPYSYNEKRVTTRCSQGQGAWVWQYMQQWLGIKVDAIDKVLTLSPRGLLSKLSWKGFKGVHHNFDIHWNEDGETAEARVKNNSNKTWTINIGFRQVSTGASDLVSWQSYKVGPEEEVGMHNHSYLKLKNEGLDRKTIVKTEIAAFGNLDGVIFKRYGAAYFADPWTWNKRNVPLALRFIVGNGSEEDWNSVSVDLKLPDQWEVQGRQPGYMSLLEKINFSGKSASIKLGALERLNRTVAAFSLKRPNTYLFNDSWSEEYRFHQPSQPGNEINLYTKDVGATEEHFFEATLKVMTKTGKEIQRKLTVPVRIRPFSEYPGNQR